MKDHVDDIPLNCDGGSLLDGLKGIGWCGLRSARFDADPRIRTVKLGSGIRDL